MKSSRRARTAHQKNQIDAGREKQNGAPSHGDISKSHEGQVVAHLAGVAASIEGIAQVSLLVPAQFAALDHHAAASDDDGQGRFEPKRRGPFTAALDGFSVQAAVRIEAGDDEGRERLARPCFAMGRLRLFRDGRVAYRTRMATTPGAPRPID